LQENFEELEETRIESITERSEIKVKNEKSNEKETEEESSDDDDYEWI
jgi:hypothetical protein